MANINIEEVMKHIDLKKIEEEKKRGKNITDILKAIDLRPVIKAEMEKSNPAVTDEEVEKVVQEIDLVKVFQNILSNEKVSGCSFDELSEEEMRILQGAGDVDVEVTPTPVITTSSAGCIAAVSAVTGGILSIAKC